MPFSKSNISLKIFFIVLSLVFSQSVFSATAVGVEVYEEGKQLFLEGKTSKAISKLGKYYRKNPKGLYADDAIMMIGVGRLKQKNKAFALKAFKRIVNEFPDSEHVAEAQKGIDALSKPKPKLKPKLKKKVKKKSANNSRRFDRSLYAQAGRALSSGDKETAIKIYTDIRDNGTSNMYVRSATSQLKKMDEEIDKKEQYRKKVAAHKKFNEQQQKELLAKFVVPFSEIDNSSVNSQDFKFVAKTNERGADISSGLRGRRYWRLDVDVFAQKLQTTLRGVDNFDALVLADFERRAGTYASTAKMNISVGYVLKYYNSSIATKNFSFTPEDGWKIDKTEATAIYDQISGQSEGELNYNFETLAMIAARMKNGEVGFADEKQKYIDSSPEFSESYVAKAIQDEENYIALPQIVMFESKKQFSYGGVVSNGQKSTFPFYLRRSMLNKHALRNKREMSSGRALAKAKELDQNLKALISKGDKKSGTTTVDSREARQKMADAEFFPAFNRIQRDFIELMARWPQTASQFSPFYQQTAVIIDDIDKVYRTWRPYLLPETQYSYLCFDLNGHIAKNGIYDKTTGLCFDEILISNTRLRELWLMDFARKKDVELTKLASKNKKSNLLEMVFSKGMKREFVSVEDDSYCLFDGCTSKLHAKAGKVVNGVVLTDAQLLAKIKPLQKRADKLLSEWRKNKNKSAPEKMAFQGKIASFVRDDAPDALSNIVRAANLKLNLMPHSKPKKYINWDKKVARPIRQLLDACLILWVNAFEVGSQSKAFSSYGAEGAYGSSLSVSNYPYLLDSLLLNQYEWVGGSRIGSISVKDKEVPSGFSARKENIEYSKPIRFHARLNTPTEIFFEGIGEQVGEVGAALVSYGVQLKEFEASIIENRKAYFDCYPKCKNLKVIGRTFSRLLIEKDLYYLQLSGKSGVLTDRLNRGMSAVFEQLSGQKGASVIDNGISLRCNGPFLDWVNQFSSLTAGTESKQFDASINAMQKFAKGDFSGLQKNGADPETIRQQAFVGSGEQYGKYQLCRDQWEFDHGERL